MHSEGFAGAQSEQPDKELSCEQRQAASEDDARELPLRAHFTEHESQSADNDRDEGERPCERAGNLERTFTGPLAPMAIALTTLQGAGRAQPLQG